MTNNTDAWWHPIFLATVVTWTAYFVFDVVPRNVEKVTQVEIACEKQGGFLLDQRNQETLCINREIILK